MVSCDLCWTDLRTFFWNWNIFALWIFLIYALFQCLCASDCTKLHLCSLKLAKNRVMVSTTSRATPFRVAGLRDIWKIYDVCKECPAFHQLIETSCTNQKDENLHKKYSHSSLCLLLQQHQTRRHLRKLTWHCWTVLVCSSLLPPLRGAVASVGLPWSRLIHHDLLPLWQFLHNDRNEQVHMILSGLLMLPIHVYFLLEYREGSQFPHIGCFCRNFQQSIHMGIYQSLFLT